MHLAAVSIVRSECDIIESFVRHNATFFDRLYILDHRSTDTTPDILRKLADEGLPLVLSREGYGIFYQGPSMTHLIKGAFDDHPWDFIIPLDSDEFLRIPDRAGLEAVLADLDPGSIGLVEVLNYVPTKGDDLNESDVLRRIVHRAKTIPDIRPKMGKVVIPGAVIKQPGFSLNEGHHGVCINGRPVPERGVEGLSLAHFPIRSINQFILRSILCRLAWSSRSDYNPSWGWHYGTFFKQLKVKPTISAADLTEAALLYVDIYIEPGQTPHQKVLVREPVTPAYDRLRFTNLDDMAVLPPILDMMEFVVDELRGARMASPGYAVPVALEAQRSVNAVGNPVEARAVTNASPSARHTFQSFWHGGALSPYELFCLKSYIDCGYAVDLYTYDLKLVAPAGVRVCDAAELVSRDEVFVYQAEGFGKGSPSAFSNYFRYKLLAERGGWWIDTDVVCLTDCIPVVNEFFARQDKDFVACGTMYFPPGHPIMLRCLEQTIKLGRTVKWGDTGPHMLTRVLEERGSLDRAVPASVCYPIHYSQAVDLLRPSKTAVLAPRIETSLFLHLWNSMLVYRGVQKTCLPPKGSLLRGWMDKHPVDGWTGEYDDSTLEGALNVKAEFNACADEKRGLQAALERQAAVAAERLERQAAVAAERLGEAVAANERQRTEIEAILASTSWGLTAPLRAGSRYLSALRLRGRHRP
jgi:Glycosyl transferase family 2/Alpha 1,4-glycosyltransferase conserved region